MRLPRETADRGRGLIRVERSLVMEGRRSPDRRHRQETPVPRLWVGPASVEPSMKGAPKKGEQEQGALSGLRGTHGEAECY